MSRVVKLEELCLPDQIGKYGIPAVAEEFSEDKVRYLRITDIDDYGNLLENDKKSVSSPEIEKYILKEGDIVFARTGNSTGRTYYHEEKNGELAFAGFLIKFSLDESKVNPKYLKYFTISKPYKQWVDNLSNGSTRGNINAKTFADCPIILPSREQQDYLVRVLSSLEDKIQINNQINQELEAMAKTLYDYWFVQFDFPDQNGNPYKSSGGKMVYNPELKREIPEGWEVEKLGDITICHDSKRVPLSSNDRELVKGEIPYYGATGIMDYVNDYIFDGDYVLMAEDGSVMTEKGTPILQRISGKNWVNNHAHVLEPIKNHSCKLLMMLLKDISVMKIKTGSIQMKINQENMNKIVVPAIPLELLSEINQKLEVIDKQQLNLIEENKQLTQLRDWLLPMLMNGQVKMK